MVLRRLVLVAGFAAALSSSAFAATTVRIALGEDPDLLDPALGITPSARSVLTLMCAKLLDYSPDAEVVPSMATKYTWGDDKLSMTLTLRPNVKFSDGEPLDAEAVRYNFDRHMNLPGSVRKLELAAITSIDVIDPLTVRLNLKEPAAPLPSIIADRVGIMVSPKAAKALGEKFGSNPVCAGPFKFVSREAQGRIIMEKSPTYIDADRVFIDRVEVIPIIDSTVRMTNLLSGQLELIQPLSPTDVDAVKGNSKLKLSVAPEIGYSYMQINMGNGERGKVLADPRLREAIDLSIDREQLVKVAFNNTFLPGNQFLAPASPFYRKDVPVPKRDVAKAKALLKEAGQPDLTFSLLTRPDREAQLAAAVVQSMLAESGIKMIIDTQDNTAGVASARRGDYNANFQFWSGRLDPDGNLTQYILCEGSLYNTGRYCNRDIEKIAAEARSTVDPAARRVLYDKASDIFLKDRPLIILWYRQLFIGHSARLQGYVSYPDFAIRLVGVKLE